MLLILFMSLPRVDAQKLWLSLVRETANTSAAVDATFDTNSTDITTFLSSYASAGVSAYFTWIGPTMTKFETLKTKIEKYEAKIGHQ